jgi:hypothetical protein
MTDKQKLQHLFDAALKAPTDFSGGPLQRAVPTAAAPAEPAPAASQVPAPQPSAALPGETDQAEQAEASAMAPPLDKAAADALGVLLDERVRRQARKRRRSALVTATVLLGLTGGGFGWFVQSPERVNAFTAAISEIRSVGDVKSMVARYQAALDRISVRGKQIDQATSALGVTPGVGNEADPHMEAEMKEMMGGEGTTVGQRNRALQKAFGDKAKEHGGPLKATAALNRADSFE